jgi:hypothetical protein
VDKGGYDSLRGEKAKTKEEELIKRYQDFLDIARVVSWCTDKAFSSHMV